MKKNIILLTLLFISLFAYSQTDTLQKEEGIIIVKEKEPLKIKKTNNIPLKATLYSTILPGLGQGYNKKYWKIPIIYGLGATLGFFIHWNNKFHNDYKTSFLVKKNLTNAFTVDANDPFPNLRLETVRVRKNQYKRDRDFLIILSLVLYGLNIVDATVDAHLKGFDVNDEVSINFEPYLDNIYNQPFLGFQINLNLK